MSDKAWKEGLFGKPNAYVKDNEIKCPNCHYLGIKKDFYNMYKSITYKGCPKCFTVFIYDKEKDNG